MKKLSQESIADFISKLAAKTATPGGGSASALAGAMAAGLVVMVCEYTKNQDDKIIVISEKSPRLLRELTDLIDKDAAAYQEVVKTKGSQAAIRQAAEVPMQTAVASLAVWQMAKIAVEKGNQNLKSDALCAVKLAEAAVYGALENVRINLPFIKEKKVAREIKQKIEQITEKTKGIVK